jgi:hypothetical protein
MDPKIYKDHYEFEWNHRSYLTSALNIPIAVATVLGSAEVVLLQKFPFYQDITTYIFVFLWVCSICFLISALIFLFKAIHGYTYQRIPTPSMLKSHYEELKAWWERNGGTEKDAEKDHDDFFYKRMEEAIEKNATNNKNKSAYIAKSNRSLILALIFLAVSSVPYSIKTINKPQKIIKVELVNISTNKQQEIQMPDEDDNQKPVNVAPESDPKPEGPPNQEIREDKTTPQANTEED